MNGLSSARKPSGAQSGRLSGGNSDLLSTSKKSKTSWGSLLGGAGKNDAANGNLSTPSRSSGSNAPLRTYGSRNTITNTGGGASMNGSSSAVKSAKAEPVEDEDDWAAGIFTDLGSGAGQQQQQKKRASAGDDSMELDLQRAKAEERLFDGDEEDEGAGDRTMLASTTTPAPASKSRNGHMSGLEDMDADLLRSAGLPAPPPKREELELVTPARPTQAPGAGSSSAPRTNAGAAPPTTIRRKAVVTSKREQGSIKAEADARFAHQPFDVVQSYNDHLDNWPGDPTVKKGKVTLGMSISPEEWKYRYMFEQKRAYTAALDERIDKMAETLQDYYDLGANAFGDPTVPSQSDIYVVGRICPGLPAPEEVSEAMEHAKWAQKGAPKLGELGIVLETSKKMGDGDRVQIVFEAECRVRVAPPAPGAQPGDEGDGLFHTDHFGVFPGMLVGLLGRNGTGEAFTVQEILLPPRLPEGTEQMNRLEKFQYGAKSMNGQPMRIMIGSGPYTSETDLEFGPLETLCEQVALDPPDLLILLGPFLSRTHPVLQSGRIDEFPDAIFKRHVGDRLAHLLEETRATQLRVALVPSTKDIISSHVAFPQPQFEKDAVDAPIGVFDRRHGIPEHKRVTCLPNPCAVWANECFIGLSTADVLRDIRAEEHVLRVEAKDDADTSSTADAISRACGHVLQQRCFYPLFPASTASNPTLPLDISHAHLADFVTITPDILVLPSVLAPTVKALQPTICINPGSVGGKTGDRGGHCALITVHPQQELPERIARAREEGGGEDKARILYRMGERTRVDLMRL